ncbi:T9SS type A sorting domain-containing protein [Fulvivirgaceae bacterium PWU4]|uniref:T9SS type A sorting domain-containing protein n=1 Tax=Chryseosolibacter histidini TaxID=2782349 RepID=A0AAP2DS47_9BACT|nr:M43 family zinc metalloprotease [Chryseosolibacter histidini]MBT1700288.1 T9SS type A sorting domain-containing protein [Chryseosolibacter histidini]
MRPNVYIATVIAVLFTCNLFYIPVWAQEKCGAEIPAPAPFGQRLVQASKIQGNTSLTSNTWTIYRIPVVVHVIHLGEPLGQGSNIADAQIFEQIQTLNEDFRRRNADTIRTPAFFKGVAADARIEFVLAKEDPDGRPTNGIVRVDASNAKEDVKKLSYWPAEDYMNVWVMDMGRGAPYYAGSAQFPVSSLPGLESASDDRLTDGVLLNYKFFGKGFETWDSSQGRTLTHETGHFLGLLHTWGNGGCSYTDYCEDTPGSGAASYSCTETASCNGPLRVMYENFMDYTSDACMNMFTRNQVMRMRTVLENSPRRLSLWTSHGLGPEDVPLTEVLSCYPNPGREKVTLLFDVAAYPGASVEVVNAMGQVLLKANVKEQESMLDVSQWEAGIYTIRVRHQAFTGLQRLAVQGN